MSAVVEKGEGMRGRRSSRGGVDTGTGRMIGTGISILPNFLRFIDIFKDDQRICFQYQPHTPLNAQVAIQIVNK